MLNSSMSHPLSGIVPPMATPLASPDRIDHEGVEALVEHLINGGMSGIFVLGTCGEGPALSFKMRSEFVERVCEHVAGRVPVLVGVSDPSIDDSVGLAEHSADCGASAIVSTIPYYYPLPQAQQTEHVVRLARRSPLPLVVYNMPGCVNDVITIDMMRRMIDEPNIVGFKDSGGDLDLFRDYCQLAIESRPQWCRLIGPEHLLVDAIEQGGTGGVHGGANVAPSLFASLYEATISDNAAAVRLYRKQADVLGRLYGNSPTAASVIAGIKMGLYLTGVCGHVTTELFPDPTEEQWKSAERVIAQLATWGLTPV